MADVRKKLRIITDAAYLYDIISEIFANECDIVRDYSDAIILDLFDAGADSLMKLDALKLDSATADTPVLVIGNTTDDGAQEIAALKAGAADYVAKPFNPEILRLRAARLF